MEIALSEITLLIYTLQFSAPVGANRKNQYISNLLVETGNFPSSDFVSVEFMIVYLCKSTATE